MVRRGRSGGAKRGPARYDRLARPEVDDALRAARSAHRRGDFEAARAAYTAVAEVCPESLDAWMNLGTVCVRLGRARQARQAFGRAARLAPRDPRVWRDAGTGLGAVGRFEEARDAFARAIDLDDALLGARLSLSRIHLEAGDRASAESRVREVLVRDPDHAPGLVELCRCRFAAGDLPGALAAARRAIAVDPGYAFAHYLTVVLGDAIDGSDADLYALRAVAPPYADAVEELRRIRARADDGFALHASRRETLLAALARAAPAGAIAELGVQHGVSTRWLAAATSGRILAFDGFQGLPEAWQGCAPGAFSTAGELPDLPAHVELHVGPFEQTLGPALAACGEPIRFVHVDSDLYASAKTALDALAPRVVRGAVVLFDELFLNEGYAEGELRALTEAATREGWDYRYVVANPFTGQAGVVLHGGMSAFLGPPFGL